MNFDFFKKKVWGVAYSEDGVLAVLAMRRGSQILLNHVILGRLDDSVECKNVKKAFAKQLFYVPVGAGHYFMNHWQDIPALARKKIMPVDFATPNVSLKNIADLNAVKSNEIAVAVRTQMEAHCSFANPVVSFCRRSLASNGEAVGAALPEDVVKQDLQFWRAFGFLLPSIGLDATAQLNLFLAFADDSMRSEWVLLIYSNSHESTCFQLLRNNQLQLHFETPRELLGLGDAELIQLLEGALRQAQQRSEAFQILRDTLVAWWAKNDCSKDPLPDLLLTRVVFISWAYSDRQGDSSIAGDVEQLNRLAERFDALGVRAHYFDPLKSKNLQTPDKYKEFLSANRLLVQKAIGMALQGL